MSKILFGAWVVLLVLAYLADESGNQGLQMFVSFIFVAIIFGPLVLFLLSLVLLYASTLLRRFVSMFHNTP